MKPETKKKWTAIGAGLLAGGGVGLVLADAYAGIIAPALNASTPTNPAFLHLGSALHQYLARHAYLPWHAIPTLLHTPAILILPGVLGGVLAALLYHKASRHPATWGGPESAGKGQHGTAHWRPIPDLTDGLYAWQPADKKGQQPSAQPMYDGATWPRSGIIAGQAGPHQAYVANREDHVLLVGTTGAGKGRRVFLPTIGILGQQKEYSFVLTDPKGELYAYSAQWLSDQGYDVIRFDLRDPRRGGMDARWNPILPVAEALARGDIGFAAKTAWQIAHGISAKSTKVETEYWSNTAESAMAGLILAVAAGNPYAQASEAAQQQAQDAWDRAAQKLYRDLPPWAQTKPDGTAWSPPSWQWPQPDHANLISVYRSLVYGGVGGNLLDAWINLLPSGHPARDAWATVAAAGGSEKTRAGILSTALTDLRLLSEPDLQWLLSAQGMPLDQPGRKKTAVFLVVPDDDSTRYPLSTLYLSQMLGALTRLADSQSSGRLPTPVLFLLDEFGNFPPLPNLSQVVTAARSRGMRLLVGLQSFSQLEHAYGRDTAKTVRENLGTWIYLLTTSPDMADEISKRLGSYTTRTESQQHPYVNFWSLSTATNIGNTSQGESLTSRPLRTPDEIMRWPDDRSLLLQQRKAPANLPLPDLSVWQQAGLFTELKRGDPRPLPDGGPEAAMWWPLQEPIEGNRAGEDPEQPKKDRRVEGEKVRTHEHTLDMSEEGTQETATGRGGESMPTEPNTPAQDMMLDPITTKLLGTGQDPDILD